jgi:hypothetical protein
MFIHPYLAMTHANGRADRLRAAAAAQRLVHQTSERRRASPSMPRRRGTRWSARLALRGAC